MPLDVTQPGQMEAVFDEIAAKWGRLDSSFTRSRSRQKMRCMGAWSM